MSTADVPSEPEVERVLVIVAHPDDVDFGSAGTIATWTAAGLDVTYCLVTSGDAGGSDLTQSYEDRASLREAEQTKAAAEVGVTKLVFLRFPDGRVEYNLDLRKALSRVIRQVKPHRVLTQSSERNLDRVYASHPDHVAVGAAAYAAVYPDARNPFAHPELLDDEGLEPWTVPEMWIQGGNEIPDAARVVVDITDVFDRKVAALRAHVSQTAHRTDLEQMLREWTGGTAKLAGLPEGRLAEMYRRVDTR
ncbi:MAG: PIG-L deacetylase family protein [Acidimicrobiales bacterium]